MIKVYLAGAMMCYGENSNKAKEWRDKTKEYFSRYCEYFECISPVDYYEYGCNYHKTSSEVMRFDLRKVKESNVVLVNLDRLKESIGTCDEILYAYLNGIPVIGFMETERELNNEELEKHIHSWKVEQIDRIETGKDAMKKAIDYIYRYYVDRYN